MPRSRSPQQQHVLPLVGQDLALDPSTLLGWVMRDWWDGSIVDDEHPRAETPYQLVRPGVALLRLSGALGLQESWCTPLGYGMVEATVMQALADLAVGAMVVQAEGPGGVVSSLLSSCARLRAAVAARGIPVFVHTQGQCLSAWAFLAQSLAGAGGLVTAEPTAQVGQMGVYRVLGFVRKALEKDGIEIRYVAAGGHKIDLFPEQDPSDEALERAQGQVTRLYETLCRDAGLGLALRRGLTPEDGYALVRAQDSRTYMGEQEAIDAGVIDRVALLDDVLEMAASAA